MSKPKLAIFDFAGCEGCQLQIVNMEEEILDLISVVHPVEWREAISDQSSEFDIAFVEGSITRPGDEEKLRRIREQAKVLVAFGSCADTGGVNKIKNNYALATSATHVYGEHAKLPWLESGPAKSVSEVVPVDYHIHGCPVDRQELSYIVRCLAQGKRPEIPTYPVCVECKLFENSCRYEHGEICLGPLTRAGCAARCPSHNTWCFGCRGTVDDPNIHAAREVMEQYGHTVAELEDRMIVFGSKQRYLHE